MAFLEILGETRKVATQQELVGASPDIILVETNPDHSHLFETAVSHFSKLPKTVKTVTDVPHANDILKTNNNVQLLAIGLNPNNFDIAYSYTLNLLIQRESPPHLLLLVQSSDDIATWDLSQHYKTAFPHRADRIHVLDKSDIPAYLPGVMDCALKIDNQPDKRQSQNILLKTLRKLSKNRQSEKYKTAVMQPI